MLVEGGIWNDSDTISLLAIAALAQHYKKPIFETIDYLKEVRRKYGNNAVRLELDFANESREALARLAKKGSE